MSRFKTAHPDFHWEDTGRIIVYNYPKNPYITRVYVEHQRSIINPLIEAKYVESKPIYFYDLTAEQKALATCIGEAQAALSKTLPREDFLKPI